MSKVLSILIAIYMLSISMVAQAATVTDARWGVNANDVLRLVISVSSPVTYNVRLEKQTLKVLVNADVADKAKGTWSVRSSAADRMNLKKENGLALLTVDLKKQLGVDDYKTFVLRQSPQNKSYRIVVDLDSAAKTSSIVVGSRPIKSNNDSVQNTVKASTGGNSWSERFKKEQQSNINKLTPSERVRLSIQQAKEAAKNKQTNTEASTTVTTTGAAANVAPVAKTEVPVKVVTPIAATSSAASNANTSVAGDKPVAKATSPAIPLAKPSSTVANTTASKASSAQGVLKRTLTARQAARREAAAEASSRKKKEKSKSVELTTKDKIEGVTIIRGTGKFKTSGGIKDKIITIDAGHGGSDPGAIGAGGAKEKNITLPIAKRLAELLTKAGAKVHMTRTADVDVHSAYATDRQELQARVNVAEKFSSDLFISIHINASVNKQITGVSSYYHPKTVQDARIARCIQNRLVSASGMNDLGIREAGFYVIKRSSMPATLLEMGFISNNREETLMVTKAYQEKAAQAIFDGIKKYFE